MRPAAAVPASTGRRACTPARRLQRAMPLLGPLLHTSPPVVELVLAVEAAHRHLHRQVQAGTRPSGGTQRKAAHRPDGGGREEPKCLLRSGGRGRWGVPRSDGVGRGQWRLDLVAARALNAGGGGEAGRRLRAPHADSSSRPPGWNSSSSSRQAAVAKSRQQQHPRGTHQPVRVLDSPWGQSRGPAGSP